MSAATNILGQYEASLTSQAGADRVATDKDTFLKLLVAQLTHQDPLNPVEDKEFIAQLAQFTQVEELQNLNTSVNSVVDTINASQVTNAASLLGTLVLAKGDNVTLSVGEAEKIDPSDANKTGWKYIYFTPPYDVESGSVNVYSTDEKGNANRLVYSESIPAGEFKGGKDYAYYWHGHDASGAAMPTGTYIISVAAKDASGNGMVVDTQSDGLVVGVETATDGNHKLELHDGRTVNYMEIDRIKMYVASNDGTDDKTDDDKTGDETSGDKTGDESSGDKTGETTGDETATE